MLFHDASLGNSVSIRVVKLLLLDENQVTKILCNNRISYLDVCTLVWVAVVFVKKLFL